MFYVVDVFSRFSSNLIVKDGTLGSALIAFERVLIFYFWAPEAVQGDEALNHQEFVGALRSYNIVSTRTCPSSQQKSPRTKARVICSIFIRWCSAEPDVDNRIIALRAVRISTDL